MNDDLSTDDCLLTAADVGQIEDVDGVRALFARLRYEADVALRLDHAQLGLEGADIKAQIKRLWRVGAAPGDGEVVVYVAEVRSVTVALMQAIARRFRTRPEHALWVLTKDYETLHFVLLDSETVSSSAPGGVPSVVIRPRSLRVSRHKPSAVALRVLRRFTFTEADGEYQWDKLRSAFTLSEWTEQYFNNRALFSDYYLNERLRDVGLTPAWGEDVRPIGREVARLMRGARSRLNKRPETVVRETMIEPLLRSLGFEFEVQKGADSDLACPDYLLYAGAERAKPIAAMLTYVWNRNLDDADPVRDEDTPREVPGALVVNVLAKADVKWVIVTNGKLWRLYSATADNKATNYYEVDLEEAVADEQPDKVVALQYWWLFFRRDAFTGFLDDVLQRSADFAKGLGDRLKERVFTSVFPHFAAGFIARMRAGGDTADGDVDLDAVFGATMTFLYRLMFVLYAESLELLPVFEASGYGAQSLRAMKRRVADAGGSIDDEAPAKLGAVFASGGTALYDQLATLFAAIDRGSGDLNLPRYNGGLFSDATPEGRFLAEHKIPDAALALGLDRLCRDVDERTHALAFIDFKSLGVRHLGSIYEGLLEFKLRIASEALAVVKDKGKEVFVPLAEVGKRRPSAPPLAVGDVYLENDKRERKASGSYYTPDYIVKYIVLHTVGPVLERKFEALTPRLAEAQKRYRQHAQTVAARAKALGPDQPPELFWNAEDMRQLADDCLDVKVLDPAMGSGHFLVEAVAFISDRLIAFLNGWSENPVWALLERTRSDILGDMEQQRVTVDPERLTRVALLKRSVLKRCIYGVDLNGMAVELAKVSLWLDAFTVGAPLSFLDHHLKRGNSLIGVRIKDVETALAAKVNQTMSLFAQSKFAGVMLATDLMRQVSYLSDNTVTQLEESTAAFRSAADLLAPYKRVLDVYTSRWFGNYPDMKKAKSVDPTVEFLGRDYAAAWLVDSQDAKLPDNDVFNAKVLAATALRVAGEKRFFHWELEFPEVFFAARAARGQEVQLREGGGFDAVVGNPPYIRQEDIDIEVKRFLQCGFEHVFDGIADLSIYFIGLGSYIVGSAGLMGYITSGMFRRLDYGMTLRRFLRVSMIVRRIVSFDSHQVFGDATTYPVVFVVENAPMADCEKAVLWIDADSANSIPSDSSGIVVDLPVDDSPWIAVPGSLLRLFSGNEDSVPLSEALSGPVYRGLTTGLNSAFVIDQLTYQTIVQSDPNSASLIWSYVGGEQVSRWRHDSDTYHAIVIPSGFTRRRYGGDIDEQEAWSRMGLEFPGIIAHLQSFEIAGRNRYDKGDFWWELRACNYYSAFQEPRILSTKISSRPTFSLEIAPVCSGNTTYVLPVHDEDHGACLLAILNSRVSEYYARHTFAQKANRYYEVQPEGLARFPIPQISRIVRQERSGADEAQAAPPFEEEILSDPMLYRTLVADYIATETTDNISDLLSRLALRMMRLSREAGVQSSAFLGHLTRLLRVSSGEASAGLSEIEGQSVLKIYYGDYQKNEPELPWPDFAYRLHQSRNRFGVPLESVIGEIEAEYEKSLAVLRPIKKQLAFTDALIDQIVYKLYGLTDEEIEIIERPAYERALVEAKAKVVGDKKLQAAIDVDPATAIDDAVDAMAGAVLPAAQRLREQVTLAAERARLDADLPGWELFPEEVVNFLLTAEYTIESLPDHLDFSTSVMSYAKAVESMLYHRLFVPFRTDSGAGADDCANTFLQQFMRAEKKLTLGSMSIILPSTKEAALRAHVLRLYPNAAVTFFGKNGVAERLGDSANVELRNAAAHDQTLGKDAARTARGWAVGILRYL